MDGLYKSPRMGRFSMISGHYCHPCVAPGCRGGTKSLGCTNLNISLVALCTKSRDVKSAGRVASRTYFAS